VEFETRVLSETSPPADVIQEDPTKPVTYKKVTQSAHTGYKTELYKVIYENGVEVSRALINKSFYNPAPRYITIGTKVVPEAPKNPEGSDIEDKEKELEQTSDSENDQEEEQGTEEENMTNPDGQLQGDIFWDSDWDEEGPEDD
jgi:uncharacterized protein YabE (DUF348 family)